MVRGCQMVGQEVVWIRCPGCLFLCRCMDMYTRAWRQPKKPCFYGFWAHFDGWMMIAPGERKMVSQKRPFSLYQDGDSFRMIRGVRWVRKVPWRGVQKGAQKAFKRWLKRGQKALFFEHWSDNWCDKWSDKFLEKTPTNSTRCDRVLGRIDPYMGQKMQE